MRFTPLTVPTMGHDDRMMPSRSARALSPWAPPSMPLTAPLIWASSASFTVSSLRLPGMLIGCDMTKAQPSNGFSRAVLSPSSFVHALGYVTVRSPMFAVASSAVSPAWEDAASAPSAALPATSPAIATAMPPSACPRARFGPGVVIRSDREEPGACWQNGELRTIRGSQVMKWPSFSPIERVAYDWLSRDFGEMLGTDGAYLRLFHSGIK